MLSWSNRNVAQFGYMYNMRKTIVDELEQGGPSPIRHGQLVPFVDAADVIPLNSFINGQPKNTVL